MKKWVVAAPQELVLVNPNTKNRSVKSYKKITIEYKYGSICINDRSCPFDSLTCEAVGGHLHFNERSFEGIFTFVIHKNSLLFINSVALEEYVYSVLKTESWPGWPCEVNKILAVAARSYVLAKMLEKTRTPYHVKNTNKDQTYQGIHSSHHLREAVDATKGLFLSYKKKPILAMFDSCCGGIIPAKMKGFNFHKKPYLKRTEVCNFCNSAKLFNWSVSYTPQELAELVQPSSSRKLHAIKEVTVVSKDAAGIVQEVLLRDQAGVKVRLSGKKMYSFLKHIKSFAFDIMQKDLEFIFKGRGYGHHLGMCQWGSRELVRSGWNYERILDFYYPHTTFMRIKDKKNKKDEGI